MSDIIGDLGSVNVVGSVQNSVSIDGTIYPKGGAGTIEIGTVTTGEAGSQASVVNVGSPSSAVLNFTIPKGDKGDKGDMGDTPVTYIESQGDAYLDTGYTPTDKTKLEIEFEVLRQEQTGMVMGTYSGATIGFNIEVNGYQVGTDKLTIGYQVKNKTAGFQIPKDLVNKKMKLSVDSDNGTLEVDGNTFTYEIGNTDTFTGTSHVQIGEREVLSHKKYYRVYSAKIYEDGTLVRNYIPVLTNTGKGALVDTLTGTTLTSKTDEEFIPVLVAPKGDKGDGATVTVGTTTTGEAGSQASVTNTGTSTDAILNFTIPKGDKGDTGANGQDGADGQDGTDGFSPIATVTKSDGTATITITDANGTTTATVSDGTDGTNGTDGQDGQDGFSPVANVTKSGDTATITITDKNGTTTTTISDGTDGTNGTDGTDGQDGYSPTATVSKSGKVATITITDKNGTTTAEVRDGEDGQGSGDMLKSTYDTDNNGIVDNAEKVNGFTVGCDVPANAVFTDTTYTAGTGIDITNGVISLDVTNGNEVSY